MYENKQVPLDQVMRFVAAAAFLQKTPEHRARLEAEMQVVTPYLHDEQAGLTYGSTIVMVLDTGIPTFAKVITREDMVDKIDANGLQSKKDQMLAVLEHKIQTHLLPCGAFSHLVPIGIPAEVPAIHAWPLAPEVWEQAALHEFEHDRFPEWVTAHVNIAATALLAHKRWAEPLIKQAIIQTLGPNR